MTESVSYLLNYCICAAAGVGVGILILQKVFKRRHSLMPCCAYFALKIVVDAHLWYALSQGAAGTWVEPFQLFWKATLSIVSFLVLYYTFDSDMVPLGVCAVISDLFAGMCIGGAVALSNMICGLDPNAGFLVAVGPHTMLAAALALATCLVVRVPLAWMLQLLCRMVLRHRMAWGFSAALLIVFLAMSTQQLSNYLALTDHLLIIGSALVLVVVPVVVLLLSQARVTRKRTELLQECVELAASYDQTIGSQLRTLEQDRAALEGHELVLERLREQGESESLAHAISHLEEEYQHLTEGTYCDKPALDAMLTAGAARLRAAGVTAHISAANMPEQTTLPATISLMLLNLASEAAERTGDVAGDSIELRIRGVGEGVFYHLSVPERWGALWSRRYLSVFSERGANLVRERRRGGWREVSVLSEGIVSCS